MTVTIIQPKQTTLYYSEGSSDKVYHVSLEANGNTEHFLVRFAFGRRGLTLQTGIKTPVPVDYDTALETFNQLVASKMAKGYTPGQDGTPHQHTGQEGRSTGIYPQLLESIADAHALGHLLVDPLYCAQEKYDGKRLMLWKHGNVVEGINRKGLIVSMPENIACEAAHLSGDCLLDGEAVGDTLHVFDLLESCGIDHRKYPYLDRLGLLAGLIPSEFNAIKLVFTAHSAREKVHLFERLRRENKEGIVLKNLTASYTPGKTSASDQLKYKFVESASFVVTLVHPTKRSVSLGLYAGSEILDAGNVTIPPNHDIPKAGTVLEVRYLYAFKQSGAIYQPVFLGEREDIEPAECTVSQLKYRHEPAATFLTLRLEAPAQIGDPAKCLVPFAELQKLGKTCLADEILDLEVLSEDKLLLSHLIGSHPVEQVVTCPPVSDFPAVPQIKADPVNLDEAARTTLLDALACASDDETRVILNGAYLDVSKPTGHYAVATDGRHLYASNSLHLALPSSVLIPDLRFISWSGFVKDGQWKLAVQPPTKDKGGYLQLESRRWTFTTKQVEGTYPNWRNITDDVREFTGTIDISDEAAEAINRIIPRLPGDDTPNHTVGLYTVSGRLYLRGFNKDQDRPTEVEVPGVSINGDPATVYVNRQYLLKAIGFGLHTIGVQEPLKPLRFSDGGSRQMIVMPVRVDANASTSSAKAPAPTPVNPITSKASDDALGQPTTISPNQSTERNQPPMQNTTTNGNGHTPAASSDSTSAPEDKTSLEQALDQIEFIKGSIRGAVTNLNGLADTLRQVQRERRLSEREVRSVRDTLKSLQTVRL